MRMKAFIASLLATSLLGACQILPPAPHAPAKTPAGVAQPSLDKVPAATPCKDQDDWNEATAPRHVFGNTWYVGTCGISVLLVATPEGHVLIDGATAKAAPHVLASLHALGVDPRDVRVLLSSHEHNDHVGGLAQLQAATGAPLFARKTAMPALRLGRGDRSDPQFGIHEGFPPIADVRELVDGGISLGGLRISAHAMPGHTPGATTWSWDSCDGGQCRHMVHADSISAISDDTFRYSDHPDYVAAFRAGLDTLAALPCDILMTPHPGGSDLWPRLRGEAPLVDTNACRAYADQGREGLATRLDKERKGTAP
mgnify:FL=1|jgi:metallo-beta-lactamase class B